MHHKAEHIIVDLLVLWAAIGSAVILYNQISYYLLPTTSLPALLLWIFSIGILGALNLMLKSGMNLAENLVSLNYSKGHSRSNHTI